LSKEAESLIKKLVCTADVRLGINGADEIKKHPFFKNVDWDNITKTKAPFVPEVLNDWDTKYFDTFQEQDPFYPENTKKKGRKDIAFLNFTYKKEMENQRPGLLHALEVLESLKQSTNLTDQVRLIFKIAIENNYAR
jgi:hypothetical protein